MTGRIVLEPSPRFVTHICDLPRGEWSGVLWPPPFPRELQGAIWLCDCGQHWWANDGDWRRISRRKASRLIRKATT